MPQGDPSLGRLAALVQEVFRLRSIMRRSKWDSNLQRTDVSIIYLIDPDVIELYAEPEKWSREVAALPSLYQVRETLETREAQVAILRGASTDGGEEGARSEAVMRATALLTGEYIFGSQLAQQFSGDRQTLYIGPEHVTDLVGHIARIENRMHGVERKIPPQGSEIYAELRHEMEVQKQLHAANRLSPDRWIESTRNALVRGLAGASHSELLAQHRLDRLNRRRILANGASHPDFDTDVIAPPVEEIEWWVNAVDEAKRRGRSSAQAREADAVTLAQIARLNQDWRAKRRVFVLISRDRGLHSAYAKWMAKERSNPNKLFAIRHPRQYVPILNVHDMGGMYRAREIFNQIDHAIEGVITAFSSSEDERYAERPDQNESVPDLTVLFRDMRERASADRFVGIAAELQEQLAEIARLWVSANSYAVAAKADVIAEVASDQAEYLKALFAKKMLPYRFSTEVSKLSSEFETLQTGSTFLRHEINAIEAAHGRVGAGNAVLDEHNRRALATEFKAFASEPFRGKTLTDLVDELPRLGRGAVTELASAPARLERLLVAGAICLDIGAWSAAANLLKRTQQSEPGEISAGLKNELEFFYCVSRRLGASAENWSKEYQASEKELLRIIENSDGREFELSRAQSELLALHLCSMAWRVELPMRRQQAIPEIDLSLRLLQSVFRQALPQRPDRGSDGWRAIRRQVVLNTFDLAFWIWALGREINETVGSMCDSALAFCESEQSGAKVGPHRQIYPILGMIAHTADEELRRGRSLEAIQGIEEVLARDKASGLAFDLPFTDRVEFTKIRRFLVERVSR